MHEARGSSRVRSGFLRRAAQATGLAGLCWLTGLALASGDLWHPPYPIDLPLSLVVAAMLTLASSVLWHLFARQVRQEAMAGRKQWLKLLLVQRQEVETALQKLVASHTHVSEVIAASDQPRLQEIWTDVASHARDVHSEQLASALAMQASLSAGLEDLSGHMRGLQIQFSQGAHQNQLIYQLHDVLSSFETLISQSNTAWSQLSKLQAHQPHALAGQDMQPEQQFEAWRQNLRALQKQLRAIEQSLRVGLGEAIVPLHSSPDLIKRFEPRGPI